MQAAIRDENPVCVLENELLYGISFPMSDEAQSPDFLVKLNFSNFCYFGQILPIVSWLGTDW